MDPFQEIRRQYPVTGQCLYLDHAAAGPISVAVCEATKTLADDQLKFGTQHHSAWTQRYQTVREQLSKLINAPSRHIAFTQNTSDGASITANGLDWQAGDNVVLSEIEFPSNFYAWQRLQKFGVEVRLVPAPSGFATMTDYAQHMDQRTRLVAVSYVQYSSGYRYPLSELATLCQEYGALLFVDGTQGIGALKLDVSATGIDMLAVSAHKWMLGPLGIGFLYLSEKALNQVQPSTLGWLSVSNPFEFDYQLKLPDDARRFEAGTENAWGIVGLGGSLKLTHWLGIEAIEAQIMRLTDKLCEGLLSAEHDIVSPRMDTNKSGIVIFRPTTQNTVSLHKKLLAAGVVCSVRNGGIRLSPHYYNNSSEIDQILRLIGVSN